MEPNLFYGKRTTRVATVIEARELFEEANDPTAIVLLPPDAGDIGDKDSDTDEIPDDPEEEYEPAGELEFEEELESDFFEEVPPRKKTLKFGSTSLVEKKLLNF